MNMVFNLGDQKNHRHVVTSEDIARFESGTVHEVYSTFALTRDAEWSGRLFVLEMKDESEEGIGTYISVEHRSPAFVGEMVDFTSTLMEVNKNEVVTSFECTVGDRIIATGVQKQKILPKEKIDGFFSSIKN